MKNNDLNILEKLFEALQTEAGQDMIMADHDFQTDFLRLKKLLNNVNRCSAVPRESFDLAQRLLQQIEDSRSEYDAHLRETMKKCDDYLPKYPFLFFSLKDFTRSNWMAVESILNELDD